MIVKLICRNRPPTANKALQAAFDRGALAKRDGLAHTENPYDAKRTPAFFNYWDWGWKYAAMGKVKFEEVADGQG